MQLTLEIPRKYFINQTAEELTHLLKLNTAIDLYKNGRLSAGAAAKFVGDMDRYQFLYECKKRDIEPQTYESIEELQSEIELLAKEL